MSTDILYGAIHSTGTLDTKFTSYGLSKFNITHHPNGHYDFKLISGSYSKRPIVIAQQYDATNGDAPYSMSKVRWSTDNTTFSVTFVNPTNEVARITAFQLIIING